MLQNTGNGNLTSKQKYCASQLRELFFGASCTTTTKLCNNFYKLAHWALA